MLRGRHSGRYNLFVWATIMCVVFMLTACGDNETMDKSPEKTVAPKKPEPVVREWYPRPKQARPLPDYVQMAPALAPQTTQSPTYYTVPAQQPPPVQPAQSQWAQPYQPPGVSPWGQAGQPQTAVAPQSPNVPQYIYVPRPWGEVTPPQKSQQQPAAQQQAVPYGTWPGYGTGASSWGTPGTVQGWGAGPYGGLPTPMLPGVTW